MLLNATTRVDANGHPIGVIGVGQDITERKDAEEEVIRLASDLQRLIDSANAPILGVDQAGRVSEWNSNLSTITGYSKQEVLGLRLEECRFVDEARSAEISRDTRDQPRSPETQERSPRSPEITRDTRDHQRPPSPPPPSPPLPSPPPPPPPIALASAGELCVGRGGVRRGAARHRLPEL